MRLTVFIGLIFICALNSRGDARLTPYLGVGLLLGGTPTSAFSLEGEEVRSGYTEFYIGARAFYETNSYFLGVDLGVTDGSLSLQVPTGKGLSTSGESNGSIQTTYFGPVIGYKMSDQTNFWFTYYPVVNTKMLEDNTLAKKNSTMSAPGIALGGSTDLEVYNLGISLEYRRYLFDSVSSLSGIDFSDSELRASEFMFSLVYNLSL